jgi:hypothetical protein
LVPANGALNQLAKESLEEKTEGRRKLSRLQSSYACVERESEKRTHRSGEALACKLFCSGVPLRSRRCWDL